VTLTVMTASDDAELYLTFDDPPRAVPDVGLAGDAVPAEAHWRAAVSIDEYGPGCLEICWRNTAAA
jgi:hypothetical protein